MVNILIHKIHLFTYNLTLLVKNKTDLQKKFCCIQLHKEVFMYDFGTTENNILIVSLFTKNMF